MTKTAFILTQPFDIPAKTVVSAGASAGIKLTPTYVHIIRSKARKDGTSTVRIRRGKAARSKSATAPTPTSDLAREFDRLALRLGYDAARERLEALLEVNL